MPRDGKTDTMTETFRPLINASEAWPALEQSVLEARREFIGSFRIFDLSTPLVSDAARAVGHDWFDLLADALRRGTGGCLACVL